MFTLIASAAFATVVLAAVWVAGPATRHDGQSRGDAFDASQARLDATQYFNHGKLREAQSLLERVVEHAPRDADARVFLAEILVGRKRLEEAYAHLTGAIELDPGHEQGRFLAGVIASKLGRPEDAARHYSKAAEVAPDNPQYPIYLGTAMLDLRKLDEAQQQVERASRLDPTLAEIYLLGAGVAEHRGRFDESLRQINRGIELLPDTDHRRLTYTLYKAQILRRGGSPGEALSLLNALDGRNYGDALVAELAECYLVLEQPAKAAAAWAELHALQPHNANAAAEVGLCLLKAGEPREAARYLSHAQRVDPGHRSVKLLEQALSDARADGVTRP